jgi:hypothetical protein
MIKEKIILDPCCGSRMMYFDKQSPYVLYCDCRTVDIAYPDSTGRIAHLHPDMEHDFRHMPFPDESFYHVVFDPPHLTRNSKKSRMALIYGSLPRYGWEQIIHDGFYECWRVLKTYGTLIFKWSEADIPVRKVIKAIGREPLYGNRSGKTSKTHWLCFIKVPDDNGGLF